MSFVSLRFDASGADADAWSDALLEAGAMAVDVTDPFAGTDDEAPVYGEPGMAATLWPVSRVAALFASADEARARLGEAAVALGRAAPPHELSPVPDQDWVLATRAQFGPIRVGPALWIVPTWCEAPDPAAQNIALDPGVAFGTGSHPTTRLCLEWLQDRPLAGATVLDYGCGSGILAIAAAKLGARAVRGIDIDPQAVGAARANALANGVDATFALPDGGAATAHDVVVANILANPLILLAPALARRVRPGGRIALSGILEAQADAVAAAYAPWFNIGPWRRSEGWALMAGARHEGVAAAP